MSVSIGMIGKWWTKQTLVFLPIANRMLNILCISIHVFDRRCLPAPCEDVKCGAHATCKTQDEEAFCVCDEGWTYDPANIAAGCQGTLASSFKKIHQIQKKKTNKDPMATCRSLACGFSIQLSSFFFIDGWDSSGDDRNICNVMNFKIRKCLLLFV